MDEDMINNLSSILKNGNIPDNLKDMISNFNTDSKENKDNSSSVNIDPNMFSSLLSSFNTSSNNNSDNTASSSNIDIETILKMKSIIEQMNKTQNDPRANLLRSLKPYLRNSRKDKLEQYVKLLSMTNVMGVFGNNRW